MRFASLSDATKSRALQQAKGPVAILIAEDEAAIAETLHHSRKIGCATLILVAPVDLDMPADLPEDVLRIDHKTRGPDITPAIVNPIVAALPDKTWVYYGYNAEFLFYPFCETRTLGEMLAFHTEERRFGMLTYVIDAYAGDLDAAPNAVSLKDAHFDRSGYYAHARKERDGAKKDRQIDVFGGLRWRFEDHIPEPRRRIDRIALVRTEKGLILHDDHTWSDPERNTYACPWHNNLTAAVVSFRAAKALKTNPASRYDIETFRWHNSAPFEWHSRQLLDLGLIEPGQWF